MADLVTHLCSVLLPGAIVPHRALGAAAIGVVLPDALGQAPPIALGLLQEATGLSIPEPLLWSFGAFHAPVGILLTTAMLSQSFVRGQRTEAFVAMTAGAAMHLLVDLLQFHHGRGYALLAPFSWETFELGLIGSESTVDLALPILGVTAAAWVVRGGLWWLRRRRPEQGAP
ncbi:MAG: hypothetical protein AAF211_15370 [Myxococcota bacterium]